MQTLWWPEWFLINISLPSQVTTCVLLVLYVYLRKKHVHACIKEMCDLKDGCAIFCSPYPPQEGP